MREFIVSGEYLSHLLPLREENKWKEAQSIVNRNSNHM